MKVGILTFHDGINHGAFMQAFSTYQFLLQNGYDVEIINYKNKKHHINELKSLLLVRNPARVMRNIKKIMAFKRAHKKMKLDSLVLNIKKLKLDYDFIVIGSDIVWNYEFKLLGSDPIYFGENLDNARLVSYAASFGSVSIESTRPDFVVNGLLKFKAISVRDENSVSIVESITANKPPVVLDPTFLIDTNEHEIEAKIDADYLLIYAYNLRDKEISSTIDFARKNNLRIVSIGYNTSWADKNINSLGPFEWLGYFKAASFVVTSTFHGTIFALKYEKNFCTSLNNNIANKVSTLINKLGLTDHLVNNSDVGKVLERAIDYNDVNLRLKPMIVDSKNYLLNTLKETN